MRRSFRCGELRSEQVGRDVLLAGWVHRRRDHGGLIFVDLRDVSGLVQIVFGPEKKELFAKAKDLRPEFVLEIRGKIRKRPEGTQNPHLPTGDVEVVSEDLTILNNAKTPPFEIEDQTTASEEVRLAYRYLDLRRKKMQENIILRHHVSQITRNFLDREGFIEVETPILTKSTPEGARDYLVPSRLSVGKFYALPQSPQLFKQLLMVSGLDRYFQISRCFRDEDLRADRQPEFTQVDIEMSFPEEKDIFDLVERLLKEIFEKTLNLPIKIPFPRMKHKESKDSYGADSPDIRFEITLHDITDVLQKCGFERFESVVKKGGRILAMNAPEGSGLSEKKIEILRQDAKERGADDIAPFKCEGGTLVSHISRHFKPELLSRVVEILKAKNKDLTLMVAAEEEIAQDALARVRDRLKERDFLNLLKGKEKECAFLWVTDFPLFEKDKETGQWTSSHHPFTAPREEDLALLSSADKNDLYKIRSRAYDIVLNGIELGSGSIRIHDRSAQEKIFEILRLSPKEQKERFGFLLQAFEYGAPPHGGIAFGLDRLVAMLVDLRDGKLSDTEEGTTIREVIAFPKTQKGTCPLTVAPSDIPTEKLKELGLEISKK